LKRGGATPADTELQVFFLFVVRDYHRIGKEWQHLFLVRITIGCMSLYAGIFPNRNLNPLNGVNLFGAVRC
jgi:hypothetical protein